jgi:hypothetical protein
VPDHIPEYNNAIHGLLSEVPVKTNCPGKKLPTILKAKIVFVL